MAAPAYTVKALDESTWAAFAALVERNNGIFGGCWCMGFHDGDSRTDPERNRSAKRRRVREGRAHANPSIGDLVIDRHFQRVGADNNGQ